jgi:apolipoprotein D and lipocalin family protein
MGKWYEVASIPQRFQQGCNCSTAEYTLMDSTYVKVVNTCRKGPDLQEKDQIEGKAFINKKGNGAKLSVQFFWPLKAKYWIIDLAEDYSWAVVGHPNRKYLWVLSRTPELNIDIYQRIISRLQDQNYNTDLLVKTNQNCNK